MKLSEVKELAERLEKEREWAGMSYYLAIPLLVRDMEEWKQEIEELGWDCFTIPMPPHLMIAWRKEDGGVDNSNPL